MLIRSPNEAIKRLSQLKPMNAFTKEKAPVTKKYSKTVKISNIKPTIDLDENNLLYGKTFVFTGDLDSMSRVDAM